jgi:Na+-driven multidrug efflux pump
MGMHQDSFRIAFGMICVYAAAGLIRMGNWVQNDTFRAAGDSVYGTVMEIIFMWAVVLPVVVLSGMVWHWPTLLVFACCYVDEPIRYVLMQRHLFSGKWIRPVTPEGIAALEGWSPKKRSE